MRPPQGDRVAIQELFHGLIRARARTGGIVPPQRLPSIMRLGTDRRDPKWFPVPGMHGGFSYRLQVRGDELQLITESWSRVVGGSGMRHVITPTQVIVEAQGFV